jgi:hypothetical protein
MRNKIYLILILFIGLIGIKSLCSPGFYTSHDGRHQIIRLMHFHQALVDGQFPVRWAGTALAGFGYPLFVFTYHLPFWLGEGWYLLSNNLGDSIKFVFIITYLASGLTMYWFAKKLWSSKLAGFLTSLLYLWAPYRFLNIFVRAALGEAVTFVFLPLVFLGLLQLARIKKNCFFWLLLTIFSLAGIILSHAITLGLWLIPLTIWFVFNFCQAQRKKGYFFLCFLSGVVSLFLTAYYWLPATLERKYTVFFNTIGDYYQAHFVTLKQLLYSPWGYGFSFPGVENDMMSFQVGMAQWLVVALVFLLILSFLVSSLFPQLDLDIITHDRRYLNQGFRQSKVVCLFVFLVIFFISLYLMLPASSHLYELINRFFTIDIPWRFLGIAVFSSSILSGGLIVLLKQRVAKTGLILLILFLTFYGNRNHLRVNQYIYLPESEYWQSEETSNEHNDYAPRWLDYSQAEKDKEQLITFQGESSNSLIKRQSNFFSFKSEVKSEEAQISTKLAYYPGWRLFIDGKEEKISSQGNGRIRVKLTRGEHLIELLFKETKLRLISDWISLATLILLIGSSLVIRESRKK